MNPDTISSWLQSAETLPDEAGVKSLLQLWPWFVPARLMEAARQHSREPFSPQSLSLVHLYGTDWVSSYRLLTAAGTQPLRSTAPAEPAESPYLTNEQSGEPAENAATEARKPINEPPVEEAASVTQEATAPDRQEENSSPAAQTAVPFIQPPYTEDYFRHQGVAAEEEAPAGSKAPAEAANTLMVVMSFTEWLNHFKIKSEQEREEEQEKSALRSMWQQEKLAAALEEEVGEIPEDVFEMAVSSITREDDLVTESLAEIMEKQEKWGAAAEMYRKLGLRNPAKSSYFASRAEAAKKRLL